MTERSEPERAEPVALDPLEMLLDAARYAEGNGGKYRNLAWAGAARAAVAKARLAAQSTSDAGGGMRETLLRLPGDSSLPDFTGCNSVAVGLALGIINIMDDPRRPLADRELDAVKHAEIGLKPLLESALSTPAAADSNASAEARLRDALDRELSGIQLTDDQIKHMVDRFLGWKLPRDTFNPDCGISFNKEPFNKHTPHPSQYEPSGTNLFDATQADAMVRYMLDGLPHPHASDCDKQGETGMNWQVSDETLRHIEEINANRRNATINANNIVAGNPSDRTADVTVKEVAKIIGDYTGSIEADEAARALLDAFKVSRK